MTIFVLSVFSCVVMNDLSGSLLSKTCRWDVRDYYMKEDECQIDGTKLHDHPIFSDMMEDRKIEGHRCVPLNVR